MRRGLPGGEHEADRIDAQLAGQAHVAGAGHAAELDAGAEQASWLTRWAPRRAVRHSLGRIPRPEEHQARRRRGGPGHGAVAAGQQLGDPGLRLLAAPDHQQAADDVAHHVVQEGVGLHLDATSSPSRATVIACRSRRACGAWQCTVRKAEKSCSPSSACAARCMASASSGQALPAQELPFQRRAHRAVEDAVAVAARARREARVEIVGDRHAPAHAHRRRQARWSCPASSRAGRARHRLSKCTTWQAACTPASVRPAQTVSIGRSATNDSACSSAPGLRSLAGARARRACSAVASRGIRCRRIRRPARNAATAAPSTGVQSINALLQLAQHPRGLLARGQVAVDDDFAEQLRARCRGRPGRGRRAPVRGARWPAAVRRRRCRRAARRRATSARRRASRARSSSARADACGARCRLERRLPAASAERVAAALGASFVAVGALGRERFGVVMRREFAPACGDGREQPREHADARSKPAPHHSRAADRRPPPASHRLTQGRRGATCGRGRAGSAPGAAARRPARCPSSRSAAAVAAAAFPVRRRGVLSSCTSASRAARSSLVWLQFSVAACRPRLRRLMPDCVPAVVAPLAPGGTISSRAPATRGVRLLAAVRRGARGAAGAASAATSAGCGTGAARARAIAAIWSRTIAAACAASSCAASLRRRHAQHRARLEQVDVAVDEGVGIGAQQREHGLVERVSRACRRWLGDLRQRVARANAQLACRRRGWRPARDRASAAARRGHRFAARRCAASGVAGVASVRPVDCAGVGFRGCRLRRGSAATEPLDRVGRRDDRRLAIGGCAGAATVRGVSSSAEYSRTRRPCPQSTSIRKVTSGWLTGCVAGDADHRIAAVVERRR